MRWTGHADTAIQSGTYIIIDPGNGEDAGLPSNVYPYGILAVASAYCDGELWGVQHYYANQGGNMGGHSYYRTFRHGKFDPWVHVEAA